MIRIIRPTSTRDQFGDGAAYEGARWEVYSIASNISNLMIKEGREGAEQMFHILNAPVEMLSNWEQELAADFRKDGNYSLSVGDVVEVDGKQFLCEAYDWKPLLQPCYEVEYNREYAM